MTEDWRPAEWNGIYDLAAHNQAKKEPTDWVTNSLVYACVAIVVAMAVFIGYAIASSGGPNFYTTCQDRGGIVATYHHAKSTELMCIKGNQVIDHD